MRRAAQPLLYLGVAGIVLVVAKVHAALIGHYDLTGSARFAWSGAYVLTLCLIAYGLGLPDLARSRRAAGSSAVAAVAVSVLSFSGIQLLVGDALLPRFVVFGAGAACVPWFGVCAELAAAGDRRRAAGDRVVVVGSDAEVVRLAAELEDAPERPATLVASLSPAEAAAVGDRVRPLVERAVGAAATVLVLDREAAARDVVVEQAATLHEAGVRVRTLSLFYEQWLGKLPVTELERTSLFFDIGEMHRARSGRIKRLVDVAAGAAGMVPLALAIPLVLVANLVGNRGPLLYRQERVGLRGRVFTVTKFRSMSDGPETGWTCEGDPRITPFGNVLRRTHVDELPQLWSVLVGDLSLVGPRPEQPHYVRELAAKLPFYHLRHLTRPGLTGWAQVKYGYAGDERDALEKLQYEFHYLCRQSLLFDLRIVARTIRSVLGREGR